jgi:hypothetical protein
MEARHFGSMKPKKRGGQTTQIAQASQNNHQMPLSSGWTVHNSYNNTLSHDE